MPKVPWDTCRSFAKKKSYGGNISYERIEKISCSSGKLAGTVLEVTKDKGLGVQAIFNDQDRHHFFVVVLVALPDDLKGMTYGQEIWQRGEYVPEIVQPPVEKPKDKIEMMMKPSVEEPKNRFALMTTFPGCIIGFPVALLMIGIWGMLMVPVAIFDMIASIFTVRLGGGGSDRDGMGPGDSDLGDGGGGSA